MRQQLEETANNSESMSDKLDDRTRCWSPERNDPRHWDRASPDRARQAATRRSAWKG